MIELGVWRGDQIQPGSLLPELSIGWSMATNMNRNLKPVSLVKRKDNYS